MGCQSSTSADDFTKNIEIAERDCLDASGLAHSEFIRKYVVIEKNGPFAVRTIIHGGELPGDKPTLLITHGYGMSAVMFFLLLKELAEHYRLVLVDNLSLGANTKNPDQPLPNTSEEAEAWLIDFWEQWVAKMGASLPEKFLIAAHSFGGYQMQLYASTHPERVSAVFFMSPSNTEEYDKKKHDPYTIRLQDDEDQCPSKSEVDKMLKARKRLEVPMKPVNELPVFMRKKVATELMETAMSRENDRRSIDAGAAYLVAMVSRFGRADSITQCVGEYFAVNKYSMLAPHRMGNPKIDFPIAYCYGDRDFFGSDAAAEIVRQNKHFSSGKSQLFKLEHSGHNLFLNNSLGLCKIMIGFFNGTITGTFDEKPRAAFRGKHFPFARSNDPCQR